MTADPQPAPPEAGNGFLLVHATLRKGGRDLLDATARFAESAKDPAHRRQALARIGAEGRAQRARQAHDGLGQLTEAPPSPADEPGR